MRKFSVFILLFAGLILAGCDALPFGQSSTTEPTPIPVVVESDIIITDGKIIPASDAWLSFEQSGLISELLVAEGDVVSKGQVLARVAVPEQLYATVTAAELELLSANQARDVLFDSVDLTLAQLQQNTVLTERSLLEAQQRLADLDTTDYSDDLDQAWETVQDDKDALDDAQDELDRVQELSEDNPTRQRAEDDLEEAQKTYDDSLREYERLKNDLEQAQKDVDFEQAKLTDLQRQAESLADGPDPDDLSLADSRIATAEAQLSAAQAALTKNEVMAPFDGTVVTLRIHQGETISAFQPAVHIVDFSQWYVETTDLSEIDIVKIDPSQAVLVIPDALPDLELKGQVEQTFDTYQERAGDIVYTVKIRLDETDPDLRWGMTVAVEFERK